MAHKWELDLFHEDVPFEFVAQVMRLAADLPQHTFQFLTKRPARMLEFHKAFARSVKPPGNIWLGVTVENQATADERRDDFEAVPAAVKFVSYEPALEVVNWSGWEFADWFISGGETGPGARPSHPDCHRRIRDFCIENDKDYLFEQWGEYAPWGGLNFPQKLREEHNSDTLDAKFKSAVLSPYIFYRVGNKLAGNKLDGVAWQQMPEVAK